MTSEKDDKEKNVIDGGRILALYRPAVKQLADLHLAGKIHGAIRPESVVTEDHIRFCFPLTEEAAKGYDTNQEIFVHLLLSDQKDGSDGLYGSAEDVHTSRRSPYISLERLIDGERADARSDVYSMCAVLYQLITGMEPPDIWERISGSELKKPSEMGIEISSSQEAALLKGLEEMGKNRYANGGELYRALYGADFEEEKKDRKKNFLRSGWTVKDDVKEIEKLRTVTFLDYIPQTKEKKWDVSAKKDGSVLAWLEETNEAFDLYIGSDGVIVAGESCYYMFSGCGKLKAISFNNNFDTSRVTDMTCMFGFCTSLEELDVSGFDTSKVINMQKMFSECTHLKKLDVNGFDTSQVINMMCMFSNCSRLTSLNVSNFDTSKVENMELMFFKCGALETLDVSGFDTSQVTNMGFMFYHCTYLETLDVNGFDTSKVTNMSLMFCGCTRLEVLDVSGFDTSQVTDMSLMFCGCTHLEALDVSGFDTSRVTNMRSMFCDCTHLEALDVRGFDTSKVTDMRSMFDRCANLKKLEWEVFDMSCVENYENMLTGTKWEVQKINKKKTV
ncbi:MAG TPA: BspA family leucine-rich repeat surface protein [Candidatus Scybalocola faecigallinarum]|uniref:BspA family leucine-rich repeat surface protein n=1 Tax=Candidatus Scybalocola faecigallinarum TaxID=2840941 RepID=A0A9D1F3A9_9FIRM|nr:BspA family leucine-rich repeat surface protein [Candidatus Scybalocola faecigallinarum]